MKNIIVGVTGGIACYKVADIVNELNKDGYEVNVIMTKHACEFVMPLTFQTLSNNQVITDMFSIIDHYDTEHITLAKKADLFLVVPATANIIGKVANGIADDMLSTTIMATKAPVIFAPAMNTVMWENKIVQDNVKRLKSFGYHVMETGNGRLACGDVGSGKLLPNQTIIAYVKDLLEKH